MGICLTQDFLIVTIIETQGFSDFILGQKLVFTLDGGKKSGNIQLPWLVDQVTGLATANPSNELFEATVISNLVKPDENVRIMIDPYLPPHELIILGGGHIALPLAIIGGLLGYRVTVVDDRPDFVSPRRFPDADRLIHCNFTCLEDVLSFGRRSNVIIVTRGHKHDLDCLRQVIKYPLAYLGMIGSRRKVQMTRRLLIEEGVDIQRIDQIHMPIGLDIGAKTPGEIAVSIAAELIKVRRRGSTKSDSLNGSLEKPIKAKENICETSFSDQEILKQAIKDAHADKPAALATIVKTTGSTPRKAGAKMLIYRDGHTSGTIGGGYSEAEIRLKALNAIDKDKPLLFRISLNADIAAIEGMTCGGSMEVFVEPLSLFKRAFNGVSQARLQPLPAE
jgi:xanthine dehydrogenase accessory factor